METKPAARPISFCDSWLSSRERQRAGRNSALLNTLPEISLSRLARRIAVRSPEPSARQNNPARLRPHRIFVRGFWAVVGLACDFFIRLDLWRRGSSDTNNANRRSAIGDNGGPVRTPDYSDGHVSLFGSIFWHPSRMILDFQSACDSTKSIPCFALLISLLRGRIRIARERAGEDEGLDRGSALTIVN